MSLPSLALIENWPVPAATAGVVRADGTVLGTHGPVDRRFPLASVTKPLAAHAALVAYEEGAIEFDERIDPDAELGQQHCRPLMPAHPRAQGQIGPSVVAVRGPAPNSRGDPRVRPLPTQADIAEAAVLIKREMRDVHAPPDPGRERIAASGRHSHRPP